MKIQNFSDIIIEKFAWTHPNLLLCILFIGIPALTLITVSTFTFVIMFLFSILGI